MDLNDSKPKWNNLCTRLKDSQCVKKISLRAGQHKILIRAVDQAGNNAEQAVDLMFV